MRNNVAFSVESPMKRLIVPFLLLGFIIPLTGCVVEGPGHPGWCYWHPHRC
jgi:hypothetical protein